jgi:hypothetical protein
LTPFGDLPDFATIAYDATDGETLWISRWDRGYADGAVGLAVHPDGSKVFVTGSSNRRVGLPDYATVAYSAATGSELWTKRYAGLAKSSVDSSRDIAIAPDGHTVFVTGDSGVPGSDVDYATVGYDVSSGSQIWARGYNGPSKHHDKAWSVTTSPVGGIVFITGESQGLEGYDFATIAYDLASGQRLWLARYDASGVDRGEALAVSPDGATVFVSGNSQNVPGATNYDFDYAIVSYAA